jgi:hypothetical protein
LISETAFAQDHSSAWRSLAPTTDLFIRRVNLQLCNREFPPLLSSTMPSRRAFINEMAFVSFAQVASGEGRGWYFEEWPSTEVVDSARKTISRLENLPPLSIEMPNKDEAEDWRNQFQRLVHFFRRIAEGKVLVPAPKFVGCGIIDTCFGDVLFGRTLYEVKAGQRPFRSVDIRQLLLYAALNKAESERQLEHVGLFNPRTGLSFSIGLDELCWEVAGSPSQDLLTELIRLISSGDVSR